MKRRKKTNKQEGNFPGSLVVKIPRSQCKGDRVASLLWELIPHTTMEIPHTVTKTWLGQINLKTNKQKTQENVVLRINVFNCYFFFPPGIYPAHHIGIAFNNN